MRKFIIAAGIIAAAAASAAAAHATEVCKSYEASQWLSKDEITAKLTAMGYEIRKVDQEDGCWEVKGMKDGKRVEDYFDPVTAELVLSK